MNGKLNPAIWEYATWRKLFLISAIWNFAGAIPGILFPALSMRLFYGIQTDNYHTLFLTSLFWGTVFLFGIGYLIVANAPVKNLGIIAMGVTGKVILASAWYCIYFLCKGRATIVVVGAATGDLIFAIYFCCYLFKNRSM
ncbi:MAG: hypothetical protein KAR40_00990 [Candidatus Sabulitectum sp.]|nr:hypothetical protein [Candidatus Sabulitectum sp.]